MRIALGVLIGLATLCAHAEHYGAEIGTRTPVKLEASIGQLAGKPAADVVIESTVDKVCEQRGCWLGLTSTAGDIQVTFKDEAFFVPSSLIGKTVVVAGQLRKIVTPSGVHYELVASGVDVIQ